MMPSDLAADRLYLFVIGPGFGESVVIRVPPDHWVVVDSCKPGERAAALEVLGRYGGQCSCAVLTHRHQDHYPGFSEILAHADWNVIGCADARLVFDDSQAPNPEHHRRNELEDIMAAILTRWETRAESRWRTWRGSRRPVGEGMLTSLHPTEHFAQANLHASPNELSSALWLEWKDVRLLLAADVENPHWSAIAQDFADLIGQDSADLGAHGGMKVPHHGSRESEGSHGALHASFLDGSRGRFWVVTPYNRGTRLPGMQDGQGVQQLLQHVEPLHLTGLPVKHDCQADEPCTTTRTDCKQGIRPRPVRVDFAGGITGTALVENEGFNCYVAGAFRADGQCEQLWHGPGSIQMTE
jgi:hypothetical protein